MDHLPFFYEEAEHLRVSYIHVEAVLARNDSKKRSAQEEADLARLRGALVNSAADGDDIDVLCRFLGRNEDDCLVDCCIQEFFWFRVLETFHAICSIPYAREKFIGSDERGDYLTLRTLTSHTMPWIYEQVLVQGCKQMLEPLGSLRDRVVDLLSFAGMRVFSRNLWMPLRTKLEPFFRGVKKSLDKALLPYFDARTLHGVRTNSSHRRVILFATRMLFDVVLGVAKTFFQQGTMRDMPMGTTFNSHGHPDEDSNLCPFSTRERGWCPSRTDQVYSSDLSMAYLVAHCLKPRVGEDHSRCRYTYPTCMRPDADLTVFSDNHHTSVCNGKCSIVSCVPEDLSRILENDDFPVVVGRVPDNQGLLNLSSSNDSAHGFVAISHVWSHGLGNPRANVILQCQLNRLFDLIESLGRENTALWIDTLCVPAGLGCDRFRRKAIGQLRRVYTEADAVLVLDKRLQEDVGEDVFVRQLELCLSDWMSRLWTLQEGLLPEPEKLFVAFRDDICPFISLLQRASLGKSFSHGFEVEISRYLNDFLQYSTTPRRSPFTDSQHARDVFAELMSWKIPDTAIYQIKGLLNVLDKYDATLYRGGKHYKPLAGLDRFEYLVATMAGRSTTHSKDEPICLATLLNVDMRIAHGYPSLTDIFLTIEELPANVVFLRGPRMTDRGLRWAPTSFLERKDASIMCLGDDPLVTQRIGHLTEKGFLIQRPGLLFESPIRLVSTPASFIARTEEHAYIVEVYPQERAVFTTSDNNTTALIIMRGHI